VTSLKLVILVLFTANIFLLGLEASKPRVVEEPSRKMTPNAEQGVPGIRLVSELGDTATDEQCFTVGPFETEATVDAIKGMLLQYTSKVSSRESEAFVDRGYWVYLPPFEDELGAREAVQALYKAGLDDVGVIKNGEFDNSVSLGYFISQSNARQRRDQIREMGYEAEFRIHREDEFRYWVDYQQKTGVEYASNVLADFVPEDLHRATACADESKAASLEAPASL
jgi:hypothetical protein